MACAIGRDIDSIWKYCHATRTKPNRLVKLPPVFPQIETYPIWKTTWNTALRKLRTMSASEIQSQMNGWQRKVKKYKRRRCKRSQSVLRPRPVLFPLGPKSGCSAEIQTRHLRSTALTAYAILLGCFISNPHICTRSAIHAIHQPFAGDAAFETPLIQGRASYEITLAPLRIMVEV